jgi:S1-C subfamily serine protease
VTAPLDHSALSAFSDSLAAAVDAGAQSIVAVHARERLASTGVHWRDGFIVTTDATVRRDHDIAVTLPSGARVPATLQGRDARSDLALLRIDAGALPVATMGDSSTLKPGHIVIALARIDAHGARASVGAASVIGGPWKTWKGGDYAQRLQSSVTLAPGFGGGPLIDVHGRTLGINSGGLSQHMATTIPGATVDAVVTQLQTTGYVARGWLGAAMHPVPLAAHQRSATDAARDAGLLVVGLADNGPAAASGLLVGDIILSINDTAVHEPDDVIAILDRTAPATVLSFGLLRGGQSFTLPVTVGERPRGEHGGWGHGKRGRTRR